MDDGTRVVGKLSRYTEDLEISGDSRLNNYNIRLSTKCREQSNAKITTEKSNKLPATNNYPTNDIQSRLRKLKKLEDAGLITKEEATEKRKSILDSL